VGGPESPTRLVARSQVRARRRSLVVLGVLAGVSVGLAVASLSGAVRTASAFDRLRDRENGADAVVFPSQVGVYEPDWDALAARPEVTAIARWELLFGQFGEGGPPEVAGGPGLLFASVDGTYLGDMGRPVVTEGRMYDPEADDEVVVDENVDDVEVGDVIPFQAYGPDQFELTGPANGASVDFRVVGKVRTLAQFLFVTDGQVFVSPGFMAAHRDEVIIAENGDIQTRHGAADIDALEESVNEVLADGAPVLDLHGAVRRIATTTDVERTALVVLAGIILLAGLALVGQAVAQSAAATVDDVTTLRAMGMTTRELTGVAVRTHLPAALTAAGVCTLTAAVASIWFPIGLAGRIDPDRGVRLTWWLLAPGVVLVSLSMLIVVAAAARRTSRTRSPKTPPRLLTQIRRSSPVPIGIGATLALAPGRGRQRVPVHQALIGASIGVLGVVATLTLGAGLTDALGHPERAGVAWDAGGLARPEDYTARGVDPDLLSSIAETDGVATVAVVDRYVVPVDGVGTPTFTVEPASDEDGPPLDLVLTDGQVPSAPDEVAIGPATADRLDVGIGDEVEVGEDGRPSTIVGEALFPSDVHATFDEGLWMPAEGFDAVVPPYTDPELAYPDRTVVVRFDDGVDVDDGLAALSPVTDERFDEFGAAEVPVELSNLDNIRTLPRLLAGFLVLLALGATGHVLATSARRRRQDFAVLRSLGLSRGGARSVLNAQGTIIGLVGVVVGVPLGVVAGRIGWGLVAASVPLEVVRPVALGATIVLVPVVIVLANGLAIWPGRRVARMHPAKVLRSE
jgi:hypothetical protein